MPGQGRLGDKAYVALDAHGCLACPHPGTGPAISGSTNVFVNKKPALRVDDTGIHAACCGTNRWRAKTGSQTVFIESKAAHRMTDQTTHCGGTGQLIEGSPNVIVGDSTAAPAVVRPAAAAASQASPTAMPAAASPAAASPAAASPAAASPAAASPAAASPAAASP